MAKHKAKHRGGSPGGGTVKAETLRARTETLKALRLAQEAAQKEAGIWGQMTVGEILHEDSRSVFVQVWKGQRRPDPFDEDSHRRARAPAPDEDWLAMMAWVNARRSVGFSRRVVAWDLSTAEARKVARTRIAEHLAAGYTVINRAEATQ